MWQYVCPHCGADLGYEPVERCAKCGARFNPEQTRIPPRFLESHKAMSEFAHKVLAPKLALKEQERLFEFFTDIFVDGFETGSFTNWTTTYGSGTREVVAGAAHLGVYGAHHTVTSGNYFITVKNLGTAYSTIFARLYVKFLSFPASGYYCFPLIHAGSAYNATQTSGGVKNDGGTMKWAMQYNQGGTEGVLLLASPNPATGTWYCLELKTVVNAGAGESRFYLDGTERLAQTGLNNTGRSNIQYIDVGVGRTGLYTTSGAMENYVDCVKVADAYVGLEAQGVLHEISVDAVAGVAPSHVQQCMFCVEKEADACSSSARMPEAVFNLPWDAVVRSVSFHQEEMVYELVNDVLLGVVGGASVEMGIFKDALVRTSASHGLTVSFVVPKSAVVDALCDAGLRGEFLLSEGAEVKVFAEASVSKGSEVRVTRVFLVLGSLAVQLTG
jgi:hypothetical protein